MTAPWLAPPQPQARFPPARPVGREAATSPSARSPGARGALTYPKPAKEPSGEDRFVFLRNGPLPGSLAAALIGSPSIGGRGGLRPLLGSLPAPCTGSPLYLGE